MIKVAVTGDPSCGKSSVCQFFKEFGAFVVSADEIVHQLLSIRTTVGQKVIELVGCGTQGDLLDRKEIAKKVFQDPILLHKLEALLHPQVKEAIEKAFGETKGPIFVAEVPLLFEAGWERDFDVIIVVDADPVVCQKRFYDPEEWQRRRARLIPQEIKKKKATYIIENQGTLSDLKQATQLIYQQLFNEESRR